MSINNDAIKEITVRLDAGTLAPKAAEYWLHQVLSDLARSIVWERDSIIDGYRVENEDAQITIIVSDVGGLIPEDLLF